MNEKDLLNKPKYNLNKYVNSVTQKVILKELNMSQPTFWRKSNKLISDPGGFEICQLKKIADILEREILDLLTLEAKIYYRFTNQTL